VERREAGGLLPLRTERAFRLCGVESSAVERFDLAGGKKVTFSGGHDSWVFSLTFSPDGETVFSGGGDVRVTVWETNGTSIPASGFGQAG
jgi:WD40 repeat protein